MSSKELARYRVLGGVLGLSPRHARRLVRRLRERGPQGLVQNVPLPRAAGRRGSSRVQGGQSDSMCLGGGRAIRSAMRPGMGIALRPAG